MQFDLPEPSPGATVAVVDQHPSQVTRGPSKPGLSDTPRPFSGNTSRFEPLSDEPVNALYTWQGAWHLVGVLQVAFLLPCDSTNCAFPPPCVHPGRAGSRLLLAHSGLQCPLKAPSFVSPASHPPA